MSSQGIYTAHSCFGGRAKWGATYGGVSKSIRLSIIIIKLLHACSTLMLMAMDTEPVSNQDCRA